jgi:ribosomal protein S25
MVTIGTKNESSLHKSLKASYGGEDALLEAQVGDYVCDAVSSSGTAIEVQTGNFAPLRKKLDTLLKNGAVQIIYPVILLKQIEVHAADGTLVSRRKSPRKGTEWDLFRALVYAPEIMATKGVELLLALVEVAEIRVADGQGSWRRKGVSIKDRVLTAHQGVVVLSKKKDYLRFVPFKKKEKWTTKELSQKAKITVSLAQKAVFVLCKTGVITHEGKRGRAYLYERLI